MLERINDLSLYICVYVCMYACETLFTDARLVNKIVGFYKGRQTIKKEKSKKIFTKKKRKKHR